MAFDTRTEEAIQKAERKQARRDSRKLLKIKTGMALRKERQVPGLKKLKSVFKRKNVPTLVLFLCFCFMVGWDTPTTQIDDNSSQWKSSRYEWSTSGSTLVYKGVNETSGATTAASTWRIWKFTWSGRNLVYKEGYLIGKWDDRASLSWD